MPGTLSPLPKFTGFANDGSVLVGGKLYTYLAGTVTPAATYTDEDLAVPNANPIILDAGGRATIYLDALTYKFALYDADDNLIWTQDDIASIALGLSTQLGELFFFGGSAESPVVDTSYPSGATIDKTHAGTGVYSIDSDNLIGTYRIQAMVMGAGGATVSVAIVNLTDAADTPLAVATGSSATGEMAESGNITFAAGGATKSYGIKAKVDTGTGYVWGVRLMRVA